MNNKNAKGIIIASSIGSGLIKSPEKPNEPKKLKKRKKRRIELMDSFSVSGGGAANVPVLTLTEAALQLITDLGGDSVVVGFYVAEATKLTLNGNKVTTWADIRASGGGPNLIQNTDASRPIWDGVSIAFDGSDDKMASSSAGRFAELNGDCCVAMVTKAATQDLFYACLMDGANPIMQGYRSGGSAVCGTLSQTTAGVAVPATGFRTLHFRTKYAGDQAGMRVGAGAETVSGTGAQGAQTPTGFVLADRAALVDPGNPDMKAVLIYKGNDWTSANKFALFNTFAAQYLGATLV